jgi:hypothetical protein
MNRLLRAAERAGHIRSDRHPIPFWVTEFSWDSKPPDPNGVPLNIQARWTSEALYRAWKAGVSAFFWLTLLDYPTNGQSYQATVQAGLWFSDDGVHFGRPKPARESFRFPVVAFPRRHGLFAWGRTPYGRRGQVILQLWKGHRWRRFARLRTDRFGIFRHTEQTRYGRNHRGLVRARFRGESSNGFPLTPTPDFYVRPFG